MKIIKASAVILSKIDYQDMLRLVEIAGRTAYKSEDKITEDSSEAFIRMIIKRKHYAVIEFDNITVRFICDRGVSHEIVRHRLFSFCQESTCYCNYGLGKFGNEITVINPSVMFDENSVIGIVWKRGIFEAEKAYLDMLNEGGSPQEARLVLPNSLKTEIVVSGNIREWRHFMKLRCAPAAHPQMRELAIPLLKEFKEIMPVFFEDIHTEIVPDKEIIPSSFIDEQF